MVLALLAPEGARTSRRRPGRFDLEIQFTSPDEHDREEPETPQDDTCERSGLLSL